MTDESVKYYELLGVAPGASARELKEAYRDLAKVWHPDRFSHDPRLQQKAQEKLKEINEAYERLTSGKAGGRAHNPAPPREPHAPPPAAPRRRRRRVIVPTAVVFCAVFFASLSTLVVPDAPRASRPTPPAEQEESRPAEGVQQRPGAAAAPPAPQPTRGKGRTSQQPPAEESSGGSAGPDATRMRPMPTVTVTIDAVTGLLATRDCPTVSRMTYPAGGQPRQYCATPHKTKVVAQPEPSRQKDSRLKSVGKVLAAPAKWLGGRKAAGDGEARDARPPGGSAGQNR